MVKVEKNSFPSCNPSIAAIT